MENSKKYAFMLFDGKTKKTMKADMAIAAIAIETEMCQLANQHSQFHCSFRIAKSSAK